MCGSRGRTIQAAVARCIGLFLLPFGLALACAASVAADDAIRLTDDGTLKFSPTFMNPDEVVFAARHSPNLMAIWRLKLSDGSLERLHPNVSDHQLDPAYSADGRYHVFSMSQTSPQLVLIIQDLRKKTEASFRPREARATARCASIAPDGSRVVFALSDVDGYQIASVNLQGQDLKLLTQTSGMNAWPAFSPDGRQIAFASSRDDDLEIYLMDADGGNPRQLTNSPGRDLRPQWSPDGNWLAFTSTRDGNEDVYLMRADGSQQTNLTSHPDRDDFPNWHPDGKRLLTVSERSGKTDLYLFPVRLP